MSTGRQRPFLLDSPAGVAQIAFLRRLAERFTRDWVVRRRLPSAVGGATVYATSAAGGLRVLRSRLRAADPLLFALAEELVTPGMPVWDVGANVGLFTFSAAGRAGPGGFVLAVEPDLDNVALLQRSRRRLDRRRSARVELLAAAVFDGQRRFLEFSIASRARSSNAVVGFGHSQMGEIHETRIVPALTLDEMLAIAPSPALVKIDVEGAEARALAGAQRLLGEVRPRLLIEVSAGENAERIGAALRQAGYRIYDAQEPPGARREVALPPWNALAVPAERLG